MHRFILNDKVLIISGYSELLPSIIAVRNTSQTRRLEFQWKNY